jgi:hypothetical protein
LGCCVERCPALVVLGDNVPALVLRLVVVLALWFLFGHGLPFMVQRGGCACFGGLNKLDAQKTVPIALRSVPSDSLESKKAAVLTHRLAKLNLEVRSGR